MALFTKEESLAYHEEPRPGKLEVLPVKPCFTQKDLSMAYSPGVANACLAIADDPSLANAYTGRGNLVAVVSNGTAVLGLGNIGPLAGKPVMEGKSVLFKAFADVNAYDINLRPHADPDEIIEVVKALEPTFGGINLEDIKAPECFYIEEVLKKEMDIPVFHDDQHGTAIISGAGLINALEITGKKAEDCHRGRVRGRSGGHRLRQVLHRTRHRSRQYPHVRLQGHPAQGTHGSEQVQGAVRPVRRHDHRPKPSRARTSSSACPRRISSRPT